MNNLDEIERLKSERQIVSKLKLDPIIVSNPRFEDELLLAIRRAMGPNNGEVAYLVSEDGMRLLVQGEYVKPAEGALPIKNRELASTEFSIDQTGVVGALKVDYSLCSPYSEAEHQQLLGQDAIIPRGNDKKFIFDTSYEQRIFDNSGIEMAINSYSDKTTLLAPSIDRISLDEQLLSPLHKPIMAYRGTCIQPMLKSNPTLQTAYREYTNLGLCHTMNSLGFGRQDASTKVEDYLVHNERPENLRYRGEAIKSFTQQAGWQVNRNYPGASLLSTEAVSDYAFLLFEQGLEESVTKVQKPKLYEALRTINEQGKPISNPQR